MPTSTSSPQYTETEARRLLMECSLTISSYGWRLAKAGYPFRQPHNAAKLLTEIDQLLFPETERQAKQRQA